MGLSSAYVLVELEKGDLAMSLHGEHVIGG